MKVGLALPQLGPLADPDAVRLVAAEAEAAGYHGLWALDRALVPLEPRSAYPAVPDGVLPSEYETSLDPIGVLTLAAACTTRIGIGTSVLVAPWYPPLLLARALTTLDHVSDGRLTVGLGIGWSVDEYEAVGVPFERRGELLDEALDVLEAAWRRDVVAYDGARVRIVPSTVLPKPRQRPRPRLLLAAYALPALDRVAQRADGWMPAALPPPALTALRSALWSAAIRHGRDPEELEVVVRANVQLFDEPLGDDRPAYCGSRHQVIADLAATRDAGADELIVELMGVARTADELLEIAGDLTGRLLEPAGR